MDDEIYIGRNIPIYTYNKLFADINLKIIDIDYEAQLCLIETKKGKTYNIPIEYIKNGEMSKNINEFIKTILSYKYIKYYLQLIYDKFN